MENSGVTAEKLLSGQCTNSLPVELRIFLFLKASEKSLPLHQNDFLKNVTTRAEQTAIEKINKSGP